MVAELFYVIFDYLLLLLDHLVLLLRFELILLIHLALVGD